MKILNLLELRRSAQVLPRRNTAETIMDFVKTIKPASKLHDYFISFTSVDKLGINPLSTYNTPNGIYSYPLPFVIKNIKAKIKDGVKLSELEMHRVVPFAGNASYVNIFYCTGRVVDLSDDNQCNSLYTHMSNMAQNNFDSSAIEEHELIKLPAGYKTKSAGERLWSLSLYLANGRRAIPDSGHDTARKWNTVFRKVGIAGLVDAKGKGVIHPNEKTQAYFTSMSDIVVVDRFRNVKHSGSNVSHTSTVDNINAGKTNLGNSGFVTELLKSSSKLAFSQPEVVSMMRDISSELINGGSTNLDILSAGCNKLVQYYSPILTTRDASILIEEIEMLFHDGKSDFERSVKLRRTGTKPSTFFKLPFLAFFNNLLRRRMEAEVARTNSINVVLKFVNHSNVPDVNVLGLVSLANMVSKEFKQRELQKVSDLIGDERYDQLFKQSILYKLR